jgi:CubicO group peptidase (beta-lactamase class C family)
MDKSAFAFRSITHAAAMAACLILCLPACGPADSGTQEKPAPSPTASTRIVLEAQMDAVLAAVPSSVDFSLCAENASGLRYDFSRGASTMGTVYQSASTSKLVAALVILRAVEDGYLALDDRPQDWLSATDWPIENGDPLYGITLTHLLSFTSGLETDPTGLFTDPAEEVREIASQNAANGHVPGAEFIYASTHLQVSGLMAVRAREAADGNQGRFLNWNDLFAEFKAQTGLFSSSAFDLPTAQPNNPRLAGGMHWTGEEYLSFLRALSRGELLGQAMMDQLLADRTPSATVVMTYSPVSLAPPNGLGEDWHYGFGLWHEYRGDSYAGQPGSRVSSPGAYGAYPFWDRARGFFGIVARQGSLGTYPEGVQIERCVDEALGQWAGLAL